MLIRLKYLYWDSIDCSRCLLVPDKEGEANDMNGLRILYADETLRGIYVYACIYIYTYIYIYIYGRGHFQRKYIFLGPGTIIFAGPPW